MDRLIGIATPEGLLSEEYSPQLGRLLGNVPQAFSHIGLIMAATALEASEEHGRATSA